MKQNILIIEDEIAIREMLRFSFANSEFNLIEAQDIKEAQNKMADNIPHLILLDWMLPGMSGIDFAKQMKKDPLLKNIPIIMLTAKAEEESKIKALEIGADDYITKPFSTRELIARIKTVLRRGPLVTIDGVIKIDDLQLNIHTNEVSVADNKLELTPIEYKLLHFFVRHPEHVYTRTQLLDHVWGGNNYIDERTVDVQMRRLRNKLKPYGYDQYLTTVRSAGYRFKK